MNKVLIWGLQFLILPLALMAQDFETDPMTIQPLVKTSQIEDGQNFTVEIKTQLPQKYHAYSDQIRLVVKDPEGFKVSQVRISNEIEFFDKFSKKNRRGFQGDSTLIFQMEAPLHLTKSAEQLIMMFSYQACSDTFCLFPLTKEVRASVQINGPHSSLMAGLEQLATEEGFAAALKKNILFAFVLIFIAGILTSFTPCIYPMIPITLSVIGQNTIDRNRRDSFLLSLAYVQGIAFVYSLLGVFAALSGHLFGQWAGNKYVLIFMCALFLVMAMGAYGFYDVQVPLWIQNKLHHRNSKNKKGYIPAFIVGMISGLVASPCVGPVLVSILAFVANTRNAFLGFFILYVYAMGLGFIFMLLGLFSQLTKLLPRSGPWMNAAKFILGSLMMMAFFYYLHQLIPELWWSLLLALTLIATSIYLEAFKRHTRTSNYQRVKQALAWATLIAAIAFAGQQAVVYLQQPSLGESPAIAADSSWLPFSEEKLIEAKAFKKPVIIDFYADWCLACHELEKETFSTSSFKEATADYSLLRFDATHNSPQLSELKKRYRIQGLPTVVFINRNGEILHPITLKNFEKVEDFLKRLKQVH